MTVDVDVALLHQNNNEDGDLELNVYQSIIK